MLCLIRSAIAACLMFTAIGASASAPVLFPSGLSFGFLPLNTASSIQNVTVYNLGTTSFTVNSLTPSLSQYKIVGGTTPVTIAAGSYQNFQVQFTPDSAKSYTGKLTFAFAGYPNQTVNVSGNGINAGAIPALSVSSLNFGNQALGAAASQTLTITNDGTASFKITGVTVTFPYSQTGWTSSTTVAPGGSLALQVSFSPVALGSAPGTLLLSYDVVPNSGVSLWGIGVAATGLGISSFATLPSGTVKAAYQATLAAAGGAAPYSWQLASGSSLPSGLSLSSAGLITGTLSSSVVAGSYTFTAKVTDSAQPAATVSAVFTLPVGSYTSPKNCNAISFNASDGSLLVPLNDLGAGSYLGSVGGLYANGSNSDDSGHYAFGQTAGSEIQRLDANGNPSPSGSYVFLSIGLSITQQSFTQFVSLANSDPARNPGLVVVNGATGGATAKDFAGFNSNFWTVITNDYLPNAGVTPQQVVAAWVLDVDGGPSGTFPGDMTNLQTQLETIAQNLLLKFPNIRIAYYSSMNYTGYSNGVKTLNPEPYAYESGFAVKNAILDQVNGVSKLNYDPLKGAVKAPWMAWGSYLWTNGMIPRSDELVWTCQDADSDGTHPSNPAGRLKFSTQLLNFLKTDPTAKSWFLAAGADPNP